MRRRIGRLAVATVVVAVAAACSGSPASTGGGTSPTSPTAPASGTSDGTGYLVAADLLDPPGPGHFTGAPNPVRGQVVARDDGCVTVLVDGVERVPVWPDGTVVAQDPTEPDRYVVTLPGGTTLAALTDGGDEFTADATVDDASVPFGDPAEPPGKVATFLALCAVPDAPVPFPDATTFRAGPSGRPTPDGRRSGPPSSRSRSAARRADARTCVTPAANTGSRSTTPPLASNNAARRRPQAAAPGTR